MLGGWGRSGHNGVRDASKLEAVRFIGDKSLCGWQAKRYRHTTPGVGMVGRVSLQLAGLRRWLCARGDDADGSIAFLYTHLAGGRRLLA
jgi:hypothetical protein